MKNYSKDALELLSSAELCDIKAGENSSGDTIIIIGSCTFSCKSSCTTCTSCTACSTFVFL